MRIFLEFLGALNYFLKMYLLFGCFLKSKTILNCLLGLGPNPSGPLLFPPAAQPPWPASLPARPARQPSPLRAAPPLPLSAHRPILIGRLASPSPAPLSPSLSRCPLGPTRQPLALVIFLAGTTPCRRPCPRFAPTPRHLFATPCPFPRIPLRSRRSASAAPAAALAHALAQPRLRPRRAGRRH